MLLLQKSLIRHRIKNVAGGTTHRFGGASSGHELIERATKGGLTVMGSTDELARSEGFRVSESGEVRITFLAPAEIGFRKEPTPPEVRQRALELGLGLCPDDLAYEPQDFGRYPLNYKPYLYAIRHINPAHVPDFITMTPVESEALIVSVWHGQTPIPTDIEIGFVLPDDWD